MALVEEDARARRRVGGDPQATSGTDLAMAADPPPHLEVLPVRSGPRLEKQWPWWAEIPSPIPPATSTGVTCRWPTARGMSPCPRSNVGGWFDIFINSTVRTFAGLPAAGRQRRGP